MGQPQSVGCPICLYMNNLCHYALAVSTVQPVGIP